MKNGAVICLLKQYRIFQNLDLKIGSWNISAKFISFVKGSKKEGKLYLEPIVIGLDK